MTMLMQLTSMTKMWWWGVCGWNWNGNGNDHFQYLNLQNISKYLQDIVDFHRWTMMMWTKQDPICRSICVHCQSGCGTRQLSQKHVHNVTVMRREHAYAYTWQNAHNTNKSSN
jgi:hypothetical protein